jgi:hypothetical protein
MIKYKLFQVRLRTITSPNDTVTKIFITQSWDTLFMMIDKHFGSDTQIFQVEYLGDEFDDFFIDPRYLIQQRLADPNQVKDMRKRQSQEQDGLSDEEREQNIQETLAQLNALE